MLVLHGAGHDDATSAGGPGHRDGTGVGLHCSGVREACAIVTDLGRRALRRARKGREKGDDLGIRVGEEGFLGGLGELVNAVAGGVELLDEGLQSSACSTWGS
ncbi:MULTISPECIES: hypothetical protein [unclassified Streptomyces]|uniref:hypothetical protein n=1 Tax=unclassified Streptomyces TaxID=2593676 RepID=UPI0033CB8FF1